MAYVYKHIRLDTNEVFYVGIGSDDKKHYNRAYSKKNRNKYWHNIVNKTAYLVEIIFNNITWEEACIKEIELIRLYGRKDLNEGSLVNLTYGGEGPYGYIHTTDSREKMSKSKIGKPAHNKGKPGTNLGKKFSEETRKKMSESSMGNTYSLGHKHSEDTKRKQRLEKLGDKNPMFGKEPWNKGKVTVVACPHCDKKADRVIMMRWHFDRCKHKQ
jgi:hypothetical protein